MEDKKKIFIVDDEDLIHETITAGLAPDEFEIFDVYEGKGAVKLIEYIQPDLVILDIMMPTRDGRDICKELKKNPITKDIKILMLTARDEQFERIVGLKLGADDYETKPFSPTHLAIKIKKMCEI